MTVVIIGDGLAAVVRRDVERLDLMDVSVADALVRQIRAAVARLSIEERRRKQDGE